MEGDMELAENMLYKNAGAPGDGTDEVQTITPSAAPVSGSFRLKFGPGADDTQTIKAATQGEWVTTGLPYSATAAEVEKALCDLPTIGLGGCGVAKDGGGVYTVTFSAHQAKRAQPLLIHHTWAGVNDLKEIGGALVTFTIARSQAGVTATCLGAPKGALLIDTTNAQLFQNGGTAAAPVWGLVGTQA
jgi:hypothetical protein